MPFIKINFFACVNDVSILPTLYDRYDLHFLPDIFFHCSLYHKLAAPNSVKMIFIPIGHIFIQQPAHPTFSALERLDSCMNNTYTQFRYTKIRIASDNQKTNEKFEISFKNWLKRS
jgi:hypothetical protein